MSYTGSEPKFTTQTPGDNSTKVATTEYVDDAVASIPVGASAVPKTYMLTGVASDIATYLKMELLEDFVAGALASNSVSVTTSETLIKEFATISGEPNLTSIPIGLFQAHYETEKAAGANNYYSYFKIYKRDISNVETLIATSDSSSQTAVNTVVQNTLSAFITSEVTLLATDRLVMKVYGVLLSSSANVTLYYDATTNARFELPVVSLGYIPENKANKSSDLTSPDNIKYPSTLAVSTALALKAAASHTHPLSEVTQSGATAGQVPEWSGAAWVPATPSGGAVPASSAIAALDIDWSLSETFYKAITANTTFTFSNITDGKTITVVLTNATGTPWDITWPTTKQEAGGLDSVYATSTSIYTFTRCNGVTYASCISGVV
jgi:hypothetical protein